MQSSYPYAYNLRNQRSTYNFIDELFERNAKLLPTRIDLSYKSNKTIAEMRGYIINDDVPHSYLCRNDILNNWEKFLNLLRWNHRTLLKELKGYIWKIEYGEDKGIHYHIMLLFNGNRVQSDYFYADQVGKMWLDITGDVGLYHNCSANKDRQYGVNSCLQVTHRNDDRTNLYQATKYLTKIDSHEDIARYLGGGGRVFGKSNR